MKIILALYLILMSGIAAAAPCTDTNRYYGDPCTPPPGPGTDEAKQMILDRMSAAQLMDSELAQLRAAYISVRNNPRASTEQQYKACEAYFDRKKAQDTIYADVLRRTEVFYHLKPNENSITIGKPTDPASQYMSGLKAYWRPEPAEYNPDGTLGIKIKGSDDQHHYGRVERDSKDGSKKLALTLENGKVLIFKEAFKLALDYKNPGYVGQLLFHESQHFNQLSRTSLDASSKRRSWASEQEDEEEAYAYDVTWASAFDLDPEDVKELNRQLKKYKGAVARNELTWKDPDPAKEKARREYYEEEQINLEDEYAALYTKVKAARSEQKEKLRRDGEEREQRQHDEENASQTKEREAALAERQMHEIAANCGYRITYRGDDGQSINVTGENESFWFDRRNKTDLFLQDLKIGLMIARACHEADSNSGRIASPECKEASSFITERESQRDFPAKFNYMFGERERRSDCINNIYDRADQISGPASFDQFMSRYLRKKEAERRARPDNSGNFQEPRKAPRRGGGGVREPETQDPEYIWDPGCNCRIRRQ